MTKITATLYEGLDTFMKIYRWILLNMGNISDKSYREFLPSPQCHHMSFVDFVVLPPGHGSSVTDFWGWDAHEAQLRCPDGVWVVTEGDEVPGGALNLNSTYLLRHWSLRESSPSRKIPTVEPGIEPGTSWLVVRDTDHWTTRLEEIVEKIKTH